MDTTTLRADLEEMQVVHSCDELLVDELKEDVIVLHERGPQGQRQSKDFIVGTFFQALRSREEEATLS